MSLTENGRVRIYRRKFAYGCNTWGDSLCPSLVAFPRGVGEFRLYGDPGLYDELVRAFLGDEGGEAQGEVEEDVARVKWLSALHELEFQSINPDAEVIREHRLVAEKLGWIERK